jgi:hypothetical protein
VTRLLVFGFHMLSAQKNVHGGIEQDTFSYTPIADDEPEALLVLDTAAEMMNQASAFASEAARALQQAVQRTVGAGVRAEESEDGRITLKKLEKTPSVEDPFGRDVLAAYWRAVQHHLVGHAAAITASARVGPSVLSEAREALRQRWEDDVAAEVWRQYRPVFEHYSTLARTMPYAHAAHRLLGGVLRKIRSVQSQPADA